MAGGTLVTVVGNLTADVGLRHTASALPVASFTVASTPRSYNRDRGLALAARRCSRHRREQSGTIRGLALSRIRW